MYYLDDLKINQIFFQINYIIIKQDNNEIYDFSIITNLEKSSKIP
jgi:hypothetical protein